MERDEAVSKARALWNLTSSKNENESSVAMRMCLMFMERHSITPDDLIGTYIPFTGPGATETKREINDVSAHTRSRPAPTRGFYDSPQRDSVMYWRTGDGRVIAIEDMELEHLVNAIHWCERAITQGAGRSWRVKLNSLLEEAARRKVNPHAEFTVHIKHKRWGVK
jgi:hypothetical protein